MKRQIILGLTLCLIFIWAISALSYNLKSSKCSPHEKTSEGEELPFRVHKTPKTDAAKFAAEFPELKEGTRGTSWATRRINVTNAAGRTMEIEFDKDDNNIAICAATGGLFRTTDGCQNWTKVAGSANNINSPIGSMDFIEQDRSTTNVWYAGSTGGVRSWSRQQLNVLYRSTDNGVTWTSRNANLPFTALGQGRPSIRVSPHNGNIYVSNQLNVWESTDGGLNWNNILNRSSDANYMFMDIDAMGNVYVSQTIQNESVTTSGPSRTYYDSLLMVKYRWSNNWTNMTRPVGPNSWQRINVFGTLNNHINNLAGSNLIRAKVSCNPRQNGCHLIVRTSQNTVHTVNGVNYSSPNQLFRIGGNGWNSLDYLNTSRASLSNGANIRGNEFVLVGQNNSYHVNGFFSTTAVNISNTSPINSGITANGGVRMSNNFYQFSYVAPHTLAHGDVISTTIDPGDDNVFYMCTDGGLFKYDLSAVSNQASEYAGNGMNSAQWLGISASPFCFPTGHSYSNRLYACNWDTRSYRSPDNSFNSISNYSWPTGLTQEFEEFNTESRFVESDGPQAELALYTQLNHGANFIDANSLASQNAAAGSTIDYYPNLYSYQLRFVANSPTRTFSRRVLKRWQPNSPVTESVSFPANTEQMRMVKHEGVISKYTPKRSYFLFQNNRVQSNTTSGYSSTGIDVNSPGDRIYNVSSPLTRSISTFFSANNLMELPFTPSSTERTIAFSVNPLNSNEMVLATNNNVYYTQFATRKTNLNWVNITKNLVNLTNQDVEFTDVIFSSLSLNMKSITLGTTMGLYRRLSTMNSAINPNHNWWRESSLAYSDISALCQSSNLFTSQSNPASTWNANSYVYNKIFISTIGNGIFASHSSGRSNPQFYLAENKALGAKLHWNGFVETDISKYELQRTTTPENAETYRTIQEFDAISKGEYEYLDEEVISDKRYHYRLKIIGVDGLDTYTYDVHYEYQIPNEVVMELYPNPSHDILNLSVENYSLGKLDIYSVGGRKVYSVIEKSSQAKIDVSSFPSGMYVIKSTHLNKSLNFIKK